VLAQVHEVGQLERLDEDRRLGLVEPGTTDLLHQRRARRNAGLDPDQASIRDVTTVEGYVD